MWLGADGIVEDIKENAFYLFQEEHLCVDEKNEPANRFRLSQNIEGGIRATQTEPHMTTIALS